MTNKVTQYLVLSQVSFFAFLGVCIAILPKFLFERNEGGVSNYGVHASTVLPFTFAFLLSAIFIALAARLLPHTTQSLRRFRIGLLVFACLLVLVTVTTYPYKLNSSFDSIHIVSTVFIFCFEMAMAIWMVSVLFRDSVNILLSVVDLVGFMLASLDFIGVVHLLFVAQLLTSLAFGIILIRTEQRLAQDYKGKL